MKKILPFITTGLLMVLIFCLSAQNSEQSSQLSGGLIRKTIELFIPNASPTYKEELVEMLHFFVRKLAHFSLYAALGFSASGMFLGRRHMWLISTIYCMIFAITDEWHQMGVDGRSPQIGDVCIDTAGAAFGAAIFLVLIMIWRRGCKND